MLKKLFILSLVIGPSPFHAMQQLYDKPYRFDLSSEEIIQIIQQAIDQKHNLNSIIEHLPTTITVQ